MDAIVPPNNTSLVTSTEERHHGHRDDCGKFLSLADRVSTAAENVMANDNSNAHHAASTAERIGLAGIDHTNQNGAEGRLVTNQNGSEGRLLTNQNGLEARTSIERNGAEIRDNTDRNGAEGRSVTERNAHEARQLVREEGHESRDVSRKEGHETREDVERFGFHLADKLDRFGLKNLDATKDALKDILLQNCHNTDKIICNDNANAKEIVLQAANNAAAINAKLCHMELSQAKDTAAIQLEAAKNFGALQLQASQNKCAIELDAAKHAAILAAQLAECCCEQKELTRQQAGETRDLINANEKERLKDERDKFREELIALRVRSTLLPPLVGSVPL